jgi:PTH1 family peptidyl-tRNA hydrolase
MNRSGQALSTLWRSRPFKLENLLVCYDDVALPAGTLRLRAKGSAGGHKGMESILEALGTEETARLRFGVGREELPADLIEFVLDSFEPAEEEAVLDRFEDAASAVLAFFTLGIEEAMNRFHRGREDLV